MFHLIVVFRNSLKFIFNFIIIMDCINNLLEDINNEHETIRGNDNNNLSPVSRDMNLNIHRKKGTVDYNTDYKNSVSKSKYRNSNQNNNRMNSVTKNDIYNNITSLDSFDMTKFNKKSNAKTPLTKSSINKMLNGKMQELTFVPNNKEIKMTNKLNLQTNKTIPKYLSEPKKESMPKYKTKDNIKQSIKRNFNPVLEQEKYDSYFENKHTKEFKRVESIESIQKRNNNLIESYIRTPNILMNTNGKEFSASIDKDISKEKNYEQSNNKYSSFTFTPNVILPQTNKKSFINQVEPDFSINSRIEQKESNRSITKSFDNQNKINRVNRIEPNFGIDTRLLNKNKNSNLSNNSFYQDTRTNNTQKNYLDKNNNKITSYNSQFNMLNIHNSDIIPSQYEKKKSSREDYNSKFQQFTPLPCTMTHSEFSMPQFNQDSKKISREDNNNRFQRFTPLGNTMAYNINRTNYIDGITNFNEMSKKDKEANKNVYKPLPKNIPGDPTINSSIKLNTGQLLPMDTRNTYKFDKK